MERICIPFCMILFPFECLQLLDISLSENNPVLMIDPNDLDIGSRGRGWFATTENFDPALPTLFSVSIRFLIDPLVGGRCGSPAVCAGCVFVPLTSGASAPD